MSKLKKLGLYNYLSDKDLSVDDDSYQAARVAREDKQGYLVQTETTLIYAEISGKLIHDLLPSDRPKVGDWVMGIQDNDSLFLIKDVLPRKNKLSRNTAGNKNEEQVLSTNIDLIFIVMGLDKDFNINRLDRYLALANIDNAETVVLLNKADTCEDINAIKDQLNTHSKNHKIIMMSAFNKDEVATISKLLSDNKTSVLLGSSGVGKSTLTNALLGSDVQAMKEVRVADNKGMHTTSFRQLFALPNGGCIIDTPGMRELSLWEDPDLLDDSFQDISALTTQCKFRNCTHGVEVGCAILEAVESGVISSKRHLNYLKMKKESDFLESKTSRKSALEYKKSQKKLHQGYKKIIKKKNRHDN